MVKIELKGRVARVNQTKLRKNPDNWHDVVIPGLDRRNDVPTVPERVPGTNESFKFRKDQYKQLVDDTELRPTSETGPKLGGKILEPETEDERGDLFENSDDDIEYVSGPQDSFLEEFLLSGFATME